MSVKLPDGAWDTHCHVFGPSALYPYAADVAYAPEDRPREMLFAMHRSINAAHGVIVQPGCHGLDMTVTLDAIAASGGSYRGVALVAEDVSFAELERLHEGGIRGIRFNYVPRLGPVPSDDVVRSLAQRIAPLGWHIVLHFEPAALAAFEVLSRDLHVPFVIDHFGRITVDDGLDQEPFRALLRMADNANCWIKISGADRASREPPHYHDVIPFAHALLERSAERILWGTDWPHPNVKGPVPAEADLVTLLGEFMPDEGLRRRVLVDNPRVLYGS